MYQFGSEVQYRVTLRAQPNRPFPSSKESHFQNEAKCETFVVKMRNICIIIENHFHINGFALSLALKVRFFGTRKWPVGLCPQSHAIKGCFSFRRLSVYAATDFHTYQPTTLSIWIVDQSLENLSGAIPGDHVR